MKNTIMTMVALMLVLVMGIAVYAEEAGQTVPAPGTETAVTETDGSTDTALEEAWNAYYAAKQSSAMTDYEAELKAMVEAGTLTQEQADLLLKDVTDRNALRDGVCPECGYRFSSSEGRNGRGCGNGRNGGMRGGKGAGMYGRNGAAVIE